MPSQQKKCLTDQEVMIEGFLIGYKQIQQEKGEVVALQVAKETLNVLLKDVDRRCKILGVFY